MSHLLIQAYLNELRDLRKVSGTTRESVVREAFKDLLKGWGRALNLIFVAEYEHTTPDKRTRYVDGALLHELRVPFGYWEAKDEKDNLDDEIAFKLRRGYPQDNIIFEDSRTAVLIQHRQEVTRCPADDPQQLERLLSLFFAYQRPEIAEFRKAVAQFKSDLPAVLGALRERIDRAQQGKSAYRTAAAAFLGHARATINPSLTEADVREMLIQHILTEEIFSKVFGDDAFHRENNVAAKLYDLEATFFTGGVKRDTLRALEPYYAAIRAAAAQITSHHEKQTFLKVIYEGFYKVYNPKSADRLGVIYTPNEIVRFMIQSADWLCQHHFGKNLIDKDVEILDPATGTGTFIAELIEHFRGQPVKLRAKYLNELHANEMAILPYYVANLNIEATYAAVTGKYEEFQNLCFVDTLDNIAWGRHAGSKGPLGDLFGAMSEENVARIQRQNERRISVIIGNPPYNANQQNENENNKNRIYPAVDARIKETYIAASAAQKTKLYDMYVRFFRWASDRVDDNGIVSFVSNSSFVHKPSFDGFRTAASQDFNEVWIVDLKGDARSAGAERRRQGANVFGNQIKVGIAVYFCVKKKGLSGCRIRYESARDNAKLDEKLDFLRNAIGKRSFVDLRPDRAGSWVGQSDEDTKSFLPIAERGTKAARVASQEQAIFKLYSLGISTNRDEWLYDMNRNSLSAKVGYLVSRYKSVPAGTDDLPADIKWSETLKRRKMTNLSEGFSPSRIVPASYRPFQAVLLYQSDLFIDRPGHSNIMFPSGQKNVAICFSDIGSRTGYCVLGVGGLADLHFGAAVDAYQQVPRYRFSEGKRLDNITDWALAQFHAHYASLSRPITKDAIFHYVYAILHDPIYRQTYAQDLKRSFPRIPFYPDFWRWADWGEALMGLHVAYEAAEPWPLRRIDIADKKASAAGQTPKPLLKADREAGTIILDTETQLGGVPAEAWTYVLGNRSALEWVLDQHKERTPKDPTIRAKFNTYRFADHKQRVIDLLCRVTRVSVETMKIVSAMRALPRTALRTTAPEITAARAQAAKSHWQIRRYASLDDMKGDEYEYWQQRPAHERMQAVTEISADTYRLTGSSPNAQRLQRTLVHLKR